MAVKRSYPRTQNTLLLLLVALDLAMAILGLMVGYWLRFLGPLRVVGVDASGANLVDYLPLLILGSVLVVATFSYLKVYDPRLILRPHRAYPLIAQGMTFWVCLFLSVSLVLKFGPGISRVFVATSYFTAFACVCLGRVVINALISRSSIRERLEQRVLIIGWSPEADQLVQAINGDMHHPYAVAGYVTINNDTTNLGRHACKNLGALEHIETIITENRIDIIIVAELNLDLTEVSRLVTLSERLYIEFKLVPSFFRIFISSLELQTVSGVPVLGIQQLHITRLLNAFTKRTVDIVGGIVGLMISLPIMMTLAILIKREGPGPVIYRQIRTGRHGHRFTIYKMRSMRVDAEKSGAQWAVAHDPRRLRVGAFMREWNLDELPQFWNVLIGDMSLVGPRPERPELIAKFEHEIPHYNPRHEVRPGLTGWAQVNGLRGNTSLVDRINYDLYYIENWSIWFDFQIMAQTFVGNKNAY